MKDLSYNEAKKLAADIDCGKIAEADQEWDEYSSDEIRSWHAAVIIHRVRKKEEQSRVGSPWARSLRIIAYPNNKARLQAQLVGPETFVSGYCTRDFLCQAFPANCSPGSYGF